MYRVGFVIALLLSAAAPGLSQTFGTAESADAATTATFPGWPAEIAGRPVKRLPLTEAERGFVEAFPGKVARFSDGERQFILRWITKATRRLHPAAHCLRASGYEVGKEGLCDSTEGSTGRPAQDSVAACYEARRDGEALWITEHIYDNAGTSWSHVSEWYWSAALGGTEGPWWALTTVRLGGAPHGAAP